MLDAERTPDELRQARLMEEYQRRTESQKEERRAVARAQLAFRLYERWVIADNPSLDFLARMRRSTD